jgi:ABC-type transporter Mla subunit MlaD
MSPIDPMEAAAGAKRAATVLREARALRRRFDKLADAANTLGRTDPTTARLLREVGDALNHLVAHLAHEERDQHRRVAQALRRGR